MAKSPKTHAVTVRFDDKTKFMLDFITRVSGASVTTTIERALKDAASEVLISHKIDVMPSSWFDYWHVVEGVRELNVILDKDYRKKYSTFEEEEKVNFVLENRLFFFKLDSPLELDPQKVDVLWVALDIIIERWNETKRDRPDHMKKLMTKKLLEAGVPPENIGLPKNHALSQALLSDDES